MPDYQNIVYRPGLFAITERLQSGSNCFPCLSFDEERNILGLPVAGPMEFPIFNDLMFANWFLVQCIKEKVIPDDNKKFFITEIANQKQWEVIRDDFIDIGVMTIVLNPCNIKAHKCPSPRFDLKDRDDFKSLVSQILKYTNNHIKK